MKIFVENLGAYNEGYSKGEWFQLPVDWKDVIHSIFSYNELDENGNPFGDFAILDYELPFHISVYEDVEQLNQIAEVLWNKVDNKVVKNILENKYSVHDILTLAHSLELKESVKEIVSLDGLFNHIKTQFENGSIYNAKCSLEDISYHSLQEDEYFIIEDNGECTSINGENLSDILDDLFEELKETQIAYI